MFEFLIESLTAARELVVFYITVGGAIIIGSIPILAIVGIIAGIIWVGDWFAARLRIKYYMRVLNTKAINVLESLGEALKLILPIAAKLGATGLGIGLVVFGPWLCTFSFLIPASIFANRPLPYALGATMIGAFVSFAILLAVFLLDRSSFKWYHVPLTAGIAVFWSGALVAAAPIILAMMAHD